MWLCLTFKAWPGADFSTTAKTHCTNLVMCISSKQRKLLMDPCTMLRSMLASPRSTLAAHMCDHLSGAAGGGGAPCRDNGMQERVNCWQTQVYSYPTHQCACSIAPSSWLSRYQLVVWARQRSIVMGPILHLCCWVTVNLSRTEISTVSQVVARVTAAKRLY